MNKTFLEAMSKISFGGALDALKNGRRVRRRGWNGKGMWLRLIGPHDNRSESLPRGDGTCVEMSCDAYIQMKTAGDTLVPWLASQTDVLAEDWEVADE